MNIQPFTIAIPQATLDDLHERLARTRWPDEAEGAGWAYGISPAYMKEVADYWLHRYDWRAHEAALNRFAQFKAEVDGSASISSTSAAKAPIRRHCCCSTAFQTRSIATTK